MQSAHFCESNCFLTPRRFVVVTIDENMSIRISMAARKTIITAVEHHYAVHFALCLASDGKAVNNPIEVTRSELTPPRIRLGFSPLNHSPTNRSTCLPVQPRDFKRFSQCNESPPPSLSP